MRGWVLPVFSAYRPLAQEIQCRVQHIDPCDPSANISNLVMDAGSRAYTLDQYRLALRDFQYSETAAALTTEAAASAARADIRVVFLIPR